jgi:glyoxylase-like metal-dependent hydrolase (beta-lactamase superfamily II)
MTAYELGPVEVADRCHAYLQPDGGWGWSNAGLVCGDGASLLVDTLFDLRLTAAMLDSFSLHTDHAPIGSVVNTHANGDHCYGNAEVVDRFPGVSILASSATAAEMPEVPPSMLAALNQAPGDVGDLFRQFFGDFEFDGIELVVPDVTFDGRVDLDVGGRRIELHEVGPAHTLGDTLVYVPDASTVFTGDILFIDGTPIVWAGPLANWVAACDLIAAWAPDVVVPGHGPLTDVAGVQTVRDYLAFVDVEATARCDAGVDAFDAARELAAVIGADDRFGAWGEFGRIAVNVDTVYRTHDPAHRSPDVVEQFRRMAQLEAH